MAGECRKAKDLQVRLLGLCLQRSVPRLAGVGAVFKQPGRACGSRLRSLCSPAQLAFIVEAGKELRLEAEVADRIWELFLARQPIPKELLASFFGGAGEAAAAPRIREQWT